MTKIIVHCLVKNEERFIWYALNSVLPYVDKIMVWDTGSSDNTIKIIKTIKSPKISFKEVGPVDEKSFTHLRQKMLEVINKQKYSWLMILDGDEVWPENSISTVTSFIKSNPKLESVVVRTHNLVGDIYHRQVESAGQYHFLGHQGHLALRFINLHIPGLHVGLPYGQEGYFDKDDQPIQNRNPQKIKIMDLYYHHATHLIRSSSLKIDKNVLQRQTKYKYEIGSKIPSAEIPEIFFSDHPKIVPDVTKTAPFSFWVKAYLITPLKYLKRLW